MLQRIFWYGFSGLVRNWWLTLVAVITMTMTLITISGVTVTNLIAEQRYRELARNVDFIVFIEDDASEDDVQILRTALEQQPGVSDVTVSSKEDALQVFTELFSNIPELAGVITAEQNPLPRDITVTFTDVSRIEEIHTFVTDERYQGVVDRTSYERNKGSIDNFQQITTFLRWVGITIAVFFLTLSILVLLNTVRLVIHSRRTEVEVMRLVGASPSYIRGPFLVEGAAYGVAAAFISLAAMWLVLERLQALVRDSFAAGSTDILTDLFGTTLGVSGQASTLPNVLLVIFLIQLTCGIALGLGSSALAVRRYLKES
jgi:cell division transport system permease protein